MGWFKKKTVDDIAIEIERIDTEKEQVLDNMKEGRKEHLKTMQELGGRDLSLETLITITLGGLGDAIETIKSDYDPLTRLTIVYMFVEQLSDEYSSSETTGLHKFSYAFFKQELSDDEFSQNFGDVTLESELASGEFGMFTPNCFWGNMFQDSIQSSNEELPDDEAKSNICAMFCADLVSLIDDDDLIQRFISLARDTLTETGFMTKSAEATFSSIEL